MGSSSCIFLPPVIITTKIQSSKFLAPSVAQFSRGAGENVKDVTSRRRTIVATSFSSADNKSFLASASRNPSYHGGKRTTPAAASSVICRSQLVADFAPATSAVYGILLLGGGLFAYTKSGSKGSVIGGVSGAALMFAAYFLMQHSETKEIGDAITFGSALLFASVFAIRLTSTRKLIPSGLLLGISICVMAVSISAYLQDRL